MGWQINGLRIANQIRLQLKLKSVFFPKFSKLVENVNLNEAVHIIVEILNIIVCNLKGVEIQIKFL